MSRRKSGYYFLGIVAKDDLLKGIIVPSFILCQSSGKSAARSGYRVMRVDTKLIQQYSVVMVARIDEHPELIEYLSNYRTRDHMHTSKRRGHKRTMKYTPEGALFWFECTSEGAYEYRGRKIFIKTIPDKAVKCVNQGFARLTRAMAATKTLSEQLSYEPNGYLLQWSTKHPTYEQHDYRSIRRKKKHDKQRNL